MKTQITINEFYLDTINENGDKIDNDIDLLGEYISEEKHKELCQLAVDTDNICLTTYESHNGITVCGNEGAFDKEFADDTLLDEVIDYIIAEMKKMMEDIVITTTQERLIEVFEENGLTPEQIKKVIDETLKIIQK